MSAAHLIFSKVSEHLTDVNAHGFLWNLSVPPACIDICMFIYPSKGLLTDNICIPGHKYHVGMTCHFLTLSGHNLSTGCWLGFIT